MKTLKHFLFCQFLLTLWCLNGCAGRTFDVTLDESSSKIIVRPKIAVNKKRTLLDDEAQTQPK